MEDAVCRMQNAECRTDVGEGDPAVCRMRLYTLIPMGLHHCPEHQVRLW